MRPCRQCNRRIRNDPQIPDIDDAINERRGFHYAVQSFISKVGQKCTKNRGLVIPQAWRSLNRLLLALYHQPNSC